MQMSWKTTYRIPILGPLIYFWGSHGRALKQAVFLWALSTLPVILRVAGASVQDFDEKIESLLDFGVQFIYSASFFSALLFIVLKRILDSESNGKLDALKKIFPGYWLYFTVAIVLLIVTAFFYANSMSRTETWLSTIFRDKGIVIYLCAVYCWYLAILDAVFQAPDYDDNLRSGETRSSQSLAERVGTGS